MKVSKDIVKKRRDAIMKELEYYNFMTVEKLVEMFDVSPVTIRRDLQYWEDRGAIIRNYGGASLIQAFIEDNTYNKKRYMRAIAKRVSLYIEDNDVIFINSSKTALMVLDFLKDKKCTIITNNARAINYNPDANVTVVFTGGEVRYPKNSLTGNYAMATLKNVTANKCIIGCSGLSRTHATTGYKKEMVINQTMFDRTKGQRFLLCDHTKIGISYAYSFAELSSIDYLITDHLANEEILNDITVNYKTKIIQVDPINEII